MRRHRRIIPAIRRRVTRKPPAHFIHVNKTGGSAVSGALRPAEFAGDYHLIFGKHRTLFDIPEGEAFVFGVRDPTTRFTSGFHSRRRHFIRDQSADPRILRPMRPGEEAIFTRFSSPNELAEALFSRDDDLRSAAREAMGTIRHFRSYWTWFGDENYLLQRQPDVLMILFQEQLAADFAILTDLLGIRASLPTDDVTSHRTPAGADRGLSDLAVENLRQWFARDFAFVELCKHLRSHLNQAVVGPRGY